MGFALLTHPTIDQGCQLPSLPPLLPNQRHKNTTKQILLPKTIPLPRDAKERLHHPLAHGDDEAAPLGKLIFQAGWDVWRARRNDDAVEGGFVGQAERTVAHRDVDIAVPD